MTYLEAGVHGAFAHPNAVRFVNAYVALGLLVGLRGPNPDAKDGYQEDGLDGLTRKVMLGSHFLSKKIRIGQCCQIGDVAATGPPKTETCCRSPHSHTLSLDRMFPLSLFEISSPNSCCTSA